MFFNLYHAITSSLPSLISYCFIVSSTFDTMLANAILNIFFLYSRWLPFIPTIVQRLVQLPGARAPAARRPRGAGARGLRARRRGGRTRTCPACPRPTTPGRETVHAY